MNQIVFKRDKGGAALLLLLEPGNLRRMQQRQPVRVRVEDLFPDGIPQKLEVLIGYSETPIGDQRELEKEFGVAAFDERTAVSEKKRPHCPECGSTIEQLGAWRSDAPFVILFCPACGCTLGTTMKSGKSFP